MLWQGQFDAALREIGVAEDDMRWLACTGAVDTGVFTFRVIDAAIHGRTDVVEDLMQRLFHRENDATVKRHVVNILDKLALGSRGHASTWFHYHVA